jgi:glycosyltransferase involved in cell wall biosynthesis
MVKDIKYVVITPARDEQEHIAATIASMASQTILPTEWIIVNDGSTDRTGSILDQHAARFPWIHVVHRDNRGFRKSGGGVVEAFYDGYRAIQSSDWEFVVKLDGDLTFGADYFEKCFQHFQGNSGLGIGGGEIYHSVGTAVKLEVTPRFHVRGATKIYRRACWEAIGHLWPAPGWDTIDEVRANMLGWSTYSFGDLPLLHHRLTGSADGLLRDSMKHGVVCYVSGYHPVFFLASCFRRLFRRIYILSSCAMCYGFLKAYVTRMPRVDDSAMIDYLREQQLRRLCGLKTIWR